MCSNDNKEIFFVYFYIVSILKFDFIRLFAPVAASSVLGKLEVKPTQCSWLPQYLFFHHGSTLVNLIEISINSAFSRLLLITIFISFSLLSAVNKKSVGEYYSCSYSFMHLREGEEWASFKLRWHFKKLSSLYENDFEHYKKHTFAIVSIFYAGRTFELYSRSNQILNYFLAVIFLKTIIMF